MNSFSLSCTLLKKVALLALGSALLVLLSGALAPSLLAQVTTPIYLADRNPHTATVTYLAPPSTGICLPGSTPNSGPCGSLTIMLDGQTVLTAPFNLAYLGLEGGAYVGFTGATGGGYQVEAVNIWSLNVGGSSIFSYPLFPSGEESNLQTNGSALVLSTESSNFLQLTPSAGDQVGSAWYINTEALAGGFTTTFQIQFTNPGGISPADGLAFVVQNGTFGGYQGDTSGGAFALGPSDSFGGELGYTGLTNSVAVQFDTFCNSEYGDICSTPTYTGEGVIPYSSADEISVQSCGTNANTVNHAATSGSGGEGVSCTFGAVDLSTVSIVQPFSLTGQTSANFSTTTNGVTTDNELTIDSSTATDAPLVCYNSSNVLNSSNCTNIQLETTNLTVDPLATWPQYVFLTPWGPSSCAVLAGGQCTIFENACSGGNTGVLASAASDYYCPMISGQTSPPTLYFGLQDLFSPPTSPVAINPGMTASLLDFTPSSPTEIWSPIGPISSTSTANPACNNPFGTSASSPAFKCDVIDTLVEMYGDQTTTRGKSPKSKGWIVTALNVPMLWTAWNFVAGGPGCPTPPGVTSSPFQLNTQPGPSNDPPVTNSDPSALLWFNKNCLLQFIVNPAPFTQPEIPNFVAAPPASISYGVEASTSPIPVTPLPGDKPQTNSSIGYPATAWTYPSSSITSLLGITSDGTYTLHWSAEDLVGNSEKSVVLLTSTNVALDTIPCLNGGSGGIPAFPTATQSCYTTSLFTLALNVDSTVPTIGSAGFSPAGSPPGTFYQGQTPVYPMYTCTDNLSGVANCGGVTVSSCLLGPGPLTVTVPSTKALSTLSAGLQNGPPVTATDCAGNMSAPFTASYTVAPTVDLQMNPLPFPFSSNITLPGIPLAFGAAIRNLSAAAADDVTVTTVFASLPKGVGPPSASISTVTCSNSPCTLKGINLTTNPCTVSGLTVTCSVSSLGPSSTNTGLWVEIILPVSRSASAGTFKSTTTVASAGLDSNKVNSVSETYFIF